MRGYLDHNATTFADARVVAAMQPYLGGAYGNASSVHRFGRAARDAVETARAQVAAQVSVQPRQLVFTSGATESNNMAVCGLLAKAAPGAVLLGAIEHPSIWELRPQLQRGGWQVEWLPVKVDGSYDLDWLQRRLQSGDVRLVAAMAANNETGVLQEAASIGALARAAGALYHCDAVQAAGKIPVDFASIGAHSMSLSAHKQYGPKGTGALVLEAGLDLQPLLIGGGHEHGLRSGTENVAALVGFGVAVTLAVQELEARSAQVLALRQQLETGLRQLPGCVIFGEHARRLPNTVQFAVPGFDGEALLMQLDRQALAVSSGSACSAGKGEPSHVLLAMGVERSLAKAAIRTSFGKENTPEDVRALLAALQALTGPGGESGGPASRFASVGF